MNYCCLVLIELGHQVVLETGLRKQSKPYPSTACGDLPRTVHLQTRHRCTTDRSDAEDLRPLGVYPEVLLPCVTAWMEQRTLGLAFLVLSHLKVHIAALRRVGFSDEEIFEIVMVAAYYALRCRMADTLGVEVDEGKMQDAALVEAFSFREAASE